MARSVFGKRGTKCSWKGQGPDQVGFCGPQQRVGILNVSGSKLNGSRNSVCLIHLWPPVSSRHSVFVK